MPNTPEVDPQLVDLTGEIVRILDGAGTRVFDGHFRVEDYDTEKGTLTAVVLSAHDQLTEILKFSVAVAL